MQKLRCWMKSGCISTVAEKNPCILLMKRIKLVENNRRLAVKKITNISGVTAVVLVMIISLLVYITPQLGYRADNVKTGSMAPAIMPNSMVIAHQVDPTTLQVGDIITFQLPNARYAICHRIINVREFTIPLSFQTKGDALENPDMAPVEAAYVLGKVEFIAPIIGVFVQFLRSKIGFVVGLIIPALVICFIIFKLLWRELVRYIRQSIPKEG